MLLKRLSDSYRTAHGDGQEARGDDNTPLPSRAIVYLPPLRLMSQPAHKAAGNVDRVPLQQGLAQLGVLGHCACRCPERRPVVHDRRAVVLEIRESSVYQRVDEGASKSVCVRLEGFAHPF